LIIVPRYHVFGSEELSAMAPGIASRIGPPSLALSPLECEKRGLRAGGMARLIVDGAEPMELTVVVTRIPDGIASVPMGVPGMPVLPVAGRAAVTGAG
jgi:NADH-quinone oxidoreductase subunit G